MGNTLGVWILYVAALTLNSLNVNEQTSAVESHGTKRRIAELNQPICFRTVLTSKWKPPEKNDQLVK